MPQTDYKNSGLPRGALAFELCLRGFTSSEAHRALGAMSPEEVKQLAETIDNEEA